MYSTRRVHNKISDVGYTTLGDPYIGTKDKLPDRWGGKGFIVPVNVPSSKISHQSEPYVEMERFTLTQPNRKKGFGTGDANRRGEYTNTIRTEQYRDLLKREIQLMEKNRDAQKEESILRNAEEKYRATRSFCEGLTETRHLYDIGRGQVTEFDPKRSRDRYYKYDGSKEKRMGGYRTMSADIGSGAWSYAYHSPEFGPTAHTKNFFDKGHLAVAGF
jgi:hypothetical protein